ncbi:MAG: Jag N-terminal domain-containing protein [Clostridia bacterium]|nr:Jag N-terminal domain-containing protein [Clostridia bacterium]
MSQELIVTGKDVDEAVVNARQILTKENPDAEIGYSIIETGSKGIFGIIGVKPAKIKAYIVGEEPTAEEKEADGAKTERRSGNRRDNNRRGNRNRRGGNRDKANNAEIAAAIASAPKTKQTPKKPIVPEADLQMTKVEVSAGDDASMDFVCRLIDNLGINVGAELYRCEDGTRRIVLTGDDAGVLIGHHGETLDALQYLSNLACTKKNENGERDHSRVTLDIQGYRAKREETLRALARAKAQKALRTGRNVMLEPMNAYERRIIHSEIQTISGVSTNSIGSDNNRKVVIYLVDEEEKTSANEDVEALNAPTEDENA